MAKSNLINKRFIRLVAVKELKERSRRAVVWECLCDCGNRVNVESRNLNSGSTKSCGCLNKEKQYEFGQNLRYKQGGKKAGAYKHGLSGTKSYQSHHEAKRRFIQKETSKNGDRDKILFIYNFCENLNLLKPGEYNVDHIRPLSVGGFHHENNLQILNSKLNRSKGNKWPLTRDEELKYRGLRLQDIQFE